MSDNTPTVLKPGVYTIEGGHGTFTVPPTITDEMIERACKAFDQEDIVNGATGTWATNWTRPLIVRVLRAALEMDDATQP